MVQKLFEFDACTFVFEVEVTECLHDFIVDIFQIWEHLLSDCRTTIKQNYTLYVSLEILQLLIGIQN